MEIKFVDNQEEKLGDLLSIELRGSTDIKIAVAFVSKSGISSIEESFLDSLSLGGKAEILVGLDFAITQASALKTLFSWAKEFPTFNFYVLPPSSSTTYHPKMYLLETTEEGIVIVGSSNLTEAGLYRNAEANLIVRSRRDGELFFDALESFLRLKFDNRRVPDENFILEYEESAKRLSKTRKAFTASELKKLSESIQTKIESLPKPQLTKDDLIGWLKLVYDVLPDGDFTNEDVYEHREHFQSKYPENQNIIEKIRQQLQYLREMDLVEHISRGNWRKL